MAINPLTEDRLRSTTLEDALARGANVLPTDDPDLLRAVTARTRVRPMATSALTSSRELPSLAPRLAIPPSPAPDRAEQMSSIGKAVSSVGKALQEPGVREVLAEFGMAFTARNQNDPGFQISQAAAAGARREIETRGLADVIAGRTSAAIAGGASPETLAAGTQARQAEERLGLAKETESRLAKGQTEGIELQKRGLELEGERVGISRQGQEFRERVFEELELPNAEVKNRIAERELELSERMQPFIESFNQARTELAQAKARAAAGALDAETAAKIAGRYSQNLARYASARTELQRSLTFAESSLIDAESGKETKRARTDPGFKKLKQEEVNALKTKISNFDRLIEAQNKQALKLMGSFEEAPSTAVDPASLTPLQRKFMEEQDLSPEEAAQFTDEFLRSKGF